MPFPPTYCTSTKAFASIRLNQITGSFSVFTGMQCYMKNDRFRAKKKKNQNSLYTTFHIIAIVLIKSLKSLFEYLSPQSDFKHLLIVLAGFLPGSHRTGNSCDGLVV